MSNVKWYWLYKIYVLTGRISYLVLLPIMRIAIRRTNRVYVCLLNKNKVLLVKGWLGNNKWVLPGGGVNKGEKLEEALSREVYEELGIKLTTQKLKLIKTGNWKSDNLGHRYSIYFIKYHGVIAKVKKIEITDASWVGIDRLNNDNTSLEVLEAISLSRNIIQRT